MPLPAPGIGPRHRHKQRMRAAAPRKIIEKKTMGLFPTSLRASDVPVKNEHRAWWLSLFALCAVLGALIGLSVKAQNHVRAASVPASNYPALVQEYLILKKNVTDQQSTIKSLRTDNAKLVSTTSTGGSQAKLLATDLSRADFFAGLTAVQGPGLVVTLSDSKKPFPAGLPMGVAPPNIIHDTDINMAVNELKAAGAEAIAINDQRLVATSWIRCAGPTVYVNATPQTPSFVIRAIGDGTKLQAAMNLPGGAGDFLRQFDPAMIKMQKTGHVTVPAYSGATQPKYAKPVVTPGETVAVAKEQG